MLEPGQVQICNGIDVGGPEIVGHLKYSFQARENLPAGKFCRLAKAFRRVDRAPAAEGRTALWLPAKTTSVRWPAAGTTKPLAGR